VAALGRNLECCHVVLVRLDVCFSRRELRGNLRNVVCCPNDAAVDFAACVDKEAERRLMAACSREHKCRAARVRGEV